MFSVKDAGERNELNSEFVTQEYKTTGLPIPLSDKQGWRRATHTCNDVYRVENKIKFLAVEALRGVVCLIFEQACQRVGQAGLRDK